MSQDTRALDDAVAREGLTGKTDTPAERARLLEMLTDTDLEEPSQRFLSNLAVKDLPLANLDEADKHEFKWDVVENTMETFIAAHPHDDSAVYGGARAVIYDDPSEALEPLSRSEIQQAWTFLWQVYARATRAEDMRQQEIAGKQSNESIVRREGFESSSGGFLNRK